MINFSEFEKSISIFGQDSNNPFPHCIVEQFFEEEEAHQLEKEFPDYDSNIWHCYKNAIEDKKVSNIWNHFPEKTYAVFSYLNSPAFVEILSQRVGVPLYADQGLHGGGWHIHGAGGNLNPHLDYSIHPKLKLQRKLNLIVYLSQDFIPSKFGGHLGLYRAGSDPTRPGPLIKEIEPLFNSAILFDTTHNSWHGMSRPLQLPAGVYRKSIAVYYLCDPPPNIDTRSKALFAPRAEQFGDLAVEELIQKRADLKTAHSVYTLHD